MLEAKYRLLIKSFAHDIPPQSIASLANLCWNTVNRYLALVRNRIAIFRESQSPLKIKIEFDESYFGSKRIKDRLYRGAYKKTPVFGIFNSGDGVIIGVVSDCAKTMLQAIKSWRADAGIVIQSMAGVTMMA